MKKFFSVIIVVCLLFCLSGCVDGNYIDSASKKISNYDLQVSYDETTHKLSGAQKVDYINLSANSLDCVKFHLYANAYRQGAAFVAVGNGVKAKAYPNGASYGDIAIDSVKVNDVAVAFNIEGTDNDILNVPLATELFPEERTNVEIIFVVSLANVLHRLGYNDNTVNLGNFYPIACYLGESGWETTPYYFNGDPFVSDIANYNVSIVANKKFKVASSGDFVSSVAIEETLKHSYAAKSIREFAMVLSDKFTVMTANVGDVAVNYYYYKDVRPNDSLLAATDSIKTFSSKFGQYPYKTYNVVETEFCQGGMEYPNMVMITSGQSKQSYEMAIIHETAHQWWYGLVGNHQINSAWVDEGLAEYSTMMFYRANPAYKVDVEAELNKAYKSYALYLDVLNSYIKSTDVGYKCSNLYKTENEYAILSYLKPMLMLDSLEEAIGADKFNKGLVKYFEEGKMKVNDAAQFMGSMERGSGVSLGGFFDTWIKGKEIIKAK